MKTDKNTLFRAIGESDEKYVSEILEEDASGMSVIKSFDAAKASTNAKKKASGVKKFMMYYLPAAAALLLCAVFVKAFLFSGNTSSSTGNAASADCAAAPEANSPIAYAPMEAANDESCEEADCADLSMDAAYIADSDNEAAGKPDTAGTYSDEGESMFIDGMPNPFTDCETLEEACVIAGIDLTIPDDYDFGLTRIYRAMNDKMIEVIFMDGDEEVYRIRKGLVSEFGEDISGDYNEYNTSSAVIAAGCEAELLGNSESEMMMARWNDGTYAYSITCEEPLPEATMIGIINMMMEK